jgi:uncharacterized protein YdiU (UPF0061 family)
LPLFHAVPDEAVKRAVAAIDRFPGVFQQYWLTEMRAKLGLSATEPEDEALVSDLLAWMHRRSADFTNTFRSLTTGRLCGTSGRTDQELESWLLRWEQRRAREPRGGRDVQLVMRQHNPAVIPRNHKVEEALSAAERGDVSVMTALLEVLATPYEHDRDLPAYSTASENQGSYRTYCGT